jgi:hypothetical protein
MTRIGMIGFANALGLGAAEPNAIRILMDLRFKCVKAGYDIPEINNIPGPHAVAKLAWLRNHIAEFKIEVE